MADLEAVLADVSYLMAMEKSKCMPAARASKKIVLPDPRQFCSNQAERATEARQELAELCVFGLRAYARKTHACTNRFAQLR
uniref:Uncharacterized protein n=1 Tax=Anopheles epiroticus TaxID=199890 RepID=A0A182PLZ1_9DIPT